MIQLKSPKEIKIMREGGRRLRSVLEKIVSEIRPGISKLKLEEIAVKEIEAQGGQASFKIVSGYKFATCLTINNEVVHGIPDKAILKDGDIIGIDVGLYYQGFHTDLATTIKVGKTKNAEIDRFLEVGRATLNKAIKRAKVGSYVGDISLSIEEEIKGVGYKPVRVLTGHGVGRKLHEDPAIPCFLDQKREKTPKLKAGMTIAIEVIYNLGSPKVVLEDDDWTISTWDGKMSGLFEETVAVTKDGPLVLTR
ncbi:MAG: type I methionyl aminopeptidase [bacterium]|nr:type I methionyl aminopeptidase [bacterium]